MGSQSLCKTERTCTHPTPACVHPTPACTRMHRPYTYMYTHAHLQVHACSHPHTYMHTYANTHHTCMHIPHACTHTPTPAGTRMHTPPHLHAHMCMHTPHTCMCTLKLHCMRRWSVALRPASMPSGLHVVRGGYHLDLILVS